MWVNMYGMDRRCLHWEWMPYVLCCFILQNTYRCHQRVQERPGRTNLVMGPTATPLRSGRTTLPPKPLLKPLHSLR